MILGDLVANGFSRRKGAELNREGLRRGTTGVDRIPGEWWNIEGGRVALCGIVFQDANIV